MKLGLYLRNMGPQSTRALIADAARAAEEAGIDDLWVADHLALIRPGIFLQGGRLNASPEESARLLAGGRPRFSPFMRMRATTLSQRISRLPVLSAGGSVTAMGLNIAPTSHPFTQLPQ